MPARIPPLYLAGQTGGGKSAAALDLARRLGRVEVVNADAFQLYRGVETLTAAPAPDEQETVPHHLFGVLDPAESCSAAEFAHMAGEAIAEVGTRALPLVVGGSGLYLKALTHGLAPVPKGEPALRAELDRLPLPDLVARYRELDPAGAARTDLANRRYVTRNLEICLLSGRPASDLKSAWANPRPRIRAVWLRRGREDLHDRIERRARAMLDGGALEEVRRLRRLPPGAGGARAIGFAAIRRHLDGETGRETCLSEIVVQTRRYAKRQATWFRRESEFLPLDVAAEESAEQTASRLLALFPPEFLLRREGAPESGSAPPPSTEIRWENPGSSPIESEAL